METIAKAPAGRPTPVTQEAIRARLTALDVEREALLDALPLARSVRREDQAPPASHRDLGSLGSLNARSAEIITAYRETGSIYRTADAFGISKSGVYKTLRANGERISHPGKPRARTTEEAHGIYLRWRDGETLEEIGQVLGCTREGVRQIIAYNEPPWLIRLTNELHKARTRTRHAARRHAERTENAEPCVTCGHLALGRHPSRYGVVTCSANCGRIYLALRFHANPHWRQVHREAIARGRLRAGTDLGWAQAVLDGGPIESQGTWITEGSSKWPAAIEACRRRLPIFDALQPELQDRIRARAITYDAERAS